MSYLDRMCRQTATHWVLSSYDAYSDPTFATPVTLALASGTGVRWENRVEKYRTAAGDEDQGKAVVWSAVTEFAVGDYLYLGTSVTTNPESVTGADRIKAVEKIPDVRNRNVLWKAIL